VARAVALDVGEQVERRRFVGADHQPPRRQIAQLGERVLELVGEVGEPARVVVDGPPRLGEHEVLGAPHVALDELVAELGLEALHGQRHGGLGAVELLRGAGEAALRDHGGEDLQGVELHKAILSNLE